jgi:hypothetical protein
LCHCDEDGTYYSRIDGWKLPEYCEENFGAVHTDEYWMNLENKLEEEENDEYDEEDVNPEFARTPASPEPLYDEEKYDEEEDVNPESSQSQESSDNLDTNATLWQRIRKFLHI